ncbi:hypothetical protein HDV00_009424 [Rhizophlyctis rosea]|nr:hypothetical protein HDV00_009424 [Rhizophlyctis rosea]
MKLEHPVWTGLESEIGGLRGPGFHALDEASAKGHLDILDWWVSKSRWGVEYSPSSIDEASSKGLLEGSGLPLQFTEDVMDGASEYGHVAVLDWWKNSGLELTWSDMALEGASANGHILEFSEYILAKASANQHYAVLDWWKRRAAEVELPFQTGGVSDYGAFEGWRPTYDWWKKNADGLDTDFLEYEAELMRQLEEEREWEEEQRLEKGRICEEEQDFEGDGGDDSGSYEEEEGESDWEDPNRSDEEGFKGEYLGRRV